MSSKIEVVLEDDQLEDWDEFVEEHHLAFDNRSDMIRTAVAQLINTFDEEDAMLEDAVLDELRAELEKIDSRITEVEDQVKLARMENVDEEEMEELVSYLLDDTRQHLYQSMMGGM